MGQIQNAILNTLGSVQQMAQLYKLTDAYAEKKKKKDAAAAKVAAEEAAQQRFDQAEERRLRSRTAGQAKEDILATPLTEEEKKKFAERYKDLEGASPRKLIDPRRKLDNSISLYPGEFTDPQYAELIREREWFKQNHPTAYERDEMDKKAKAQRSPQEQADTNENIEKAKNMARGGKK